MKNSLFKTCETCNGTNDVLINSHFNDDPRHDELEPCPTCIDGRVVNQEVIDERMFEYECLIETINERIKRMQDLIADIKEHRSILRDSKYRL